MKSGKKVCFTLAAVLIMCMALVFTGCGKKAETAKDFHTEAQANYLKDDYKNFKTYADGTKELSIPDPVKIEFEGDGSRGYKVLLSESEDLSNPVEIYTETSKDDNTFSVYNLKIGKTYYYQVKGEKKTSEIKQFTVSASAPRNLYVDGVTNVRDLGGWKYGEKTVKQGVIFRTSKFNKDESTELMITEKGINTLVNELGIKTEIDLRTVDDNENGGITESPLGNGVKYVSVPIVSGGNIITLNKDKLKDIFAVFGDESNYPICFHCSIGTDRTGMLAFLINGLMGVSEEDLYRDFLFSNFGEIGSVRTPSIIKTYMSTVDLASGSTLSEKIRSFLINNGVAESDLNTLVKMLTE